MSGQSKETDMLDNIRSALSPAAVTALCWGVLVAIIAGAGAAL